jgi:hypothetical protein
MTALALGLSPNKALYGVIYDIYRAVSSSIMAGLQQSPGAGQAASEAARRGWLAIRPATDNQK